MRRSFSVLAASLVLLSAAGCGSSEPDAVGGSELEEQVSAALEKEVGQAPDDMSCPDELKAEKGATTKCTLTAGSDKLGVTVTTTSVSDDGQVKFNVKVDQQTS